MRWAEHVIFRFWRCCGRVRPRARLSMCAHGARMGVRNRNPRLPARVGAAVVGRGRNPRRACDSDVFYFLAILVRYQWFLAIASRRNSNPRGPSSFSVRATGIGLSTPMSVRSVSGITTEGG